MRYLLPLLPLLLLGCAGKQAEPVKTPEGLDGWEIPHCVQTSQCYKWASQACPSGFEVRTWNGGSPRIVVCKLE